MSLADLLANGVGLPSSLRPSIGYPIAVSILLVAFIFPMPAVGQLGNNWVSATYTKKIHLDDESGLQTFNWSTSKSVCSPTCADYSYDSATDTETFRLFDGRTNRSEIRLQNEYSSGIRQFEGYVTFYQPLNDESLFQIFGSTEGATLCMMRGYSSSGGKIRVVGGIGDIQTNTYGVERRINVIHNQNKYVQFYVDGVLKGEFNENEQVENYWKYGNYGTVATDTVPAVVKWRAARTFRDGVPPGGHSSPIGAYEAEDALLSGPLASASQPGFTGAGFADFVNPSGDFIDWTVNAQVAGRYDLKFRYALQSGSRPMALQVNGQVVNTAMSFPATGNWTTWQYVTLPAQQLLAGVNTIRVTAARIGRSQYRSSAAFAIADKSWRLQLGWVRYAADYVVWRRSKGQQVTPGTGADGNVNGTVDDDDYVLWQTRYGSTLAAGAGAATMISTVPEPGMAISIVFTTLSLFLVRFKSHRESLSNHQFSKATGQ